MVFTNEQSNQRVTRGLEDEIIWLYMEHLPYKEFTDRLKILFDTWITERRNG